MLGWHSLVFVALIKISFDLILEGVATEVVKEIGRCNSVSKGTRL